MRAAKPSAGNTSAPKPPRPAPEPSPEPCWTWPGSAPKPNGLTFSGTLLNVTWLCTKASQTFSGTFSGTLLNLTRLCTKASQTFSRTFSCTKASLEPSPEPCWTSAGSAPKPPRPSPKLALHQSLPDLLRNLLRNPVEPDLALHQSRPPKPPRPSPEPSPEPFWIDLALRQSLRETPSPEPSPEPCWTWPGSAPKLPRPAPEPSPEPCWTWLGLAPQPPRPSPEPSTLLALHQSFPGTFSGTFARTLLNVAWLCTKASQPSEPSPQPPWTWPGACTSSHRSYSGLKTPSAYAVGEKCKIKKKKRLLLSSDYFLRLCFSRTTIFFGLFFRLFFEIMFYL